MAAPIALPRIMRIMRIGGGAVAEIGEVVSGLGLTRPLVVTDSFLVSTGAAEQMIKTLEAAGLTPRLFDGTVPDPITDSLDAGVAAIAEHDADSVIGFGGGSPMDTAKALGILGSQGGQMRDYKAPRNNTGPALPVIAVPTTAGSGSEATQFTVITDSASDEKMLCPGLAFLPVAAVIDYELTASMPPRLTADTGAAHNLVAALRELCRDVAVPTPKAYGIDKARWDELIPLMAAQAPASGSPNNNPLVPTDAQIRDLYAQIYG